MSEFTCPLCGMTSHNPSDAEHGYCGNCHVFIPAGLRAVIHNLVINAVTGTSGQSAFKEREIRRRLVPQLLREARKLFAELEAQVD